MCADWSGESTAPIQYGLCARINYTTFCNRMQVNCENSESAKDNYNNLS